MEEYKRDHPDVDESAIRVGLPEAPKAQDQGVVAPGVVPNIYHPMVYPVYNPIPIPIVGQAQVYPQVQVPFPPPPKPHVPLGRRHPVAHHLQPQQPRQARNTRTRTRTRAALAEEQQRQAQQKRQAAANAKAERVRMAEQVRMAEEEN